MKVERTIRITAATTWLPDARYPAASAVAAGAITAEQAAGAACSAVPVGAAVPAWWMGSQAARQCLGEHGVDPVEIDLVTYAGMTPGEEDPWSPAHRLARVLGASRAVAIGLAQMSNGGAAGIGWAATLMQADDSVRHALCTTAGNFSALPYDRWQTAPATVFGDGATAVLLGRDEGPLVIRSLGSAGRPLLEETFPAFHPFRPLPEPVSGPREDALGFASNLKGSREVIQEAVGIALADAGLGDEDTARERIALVSSNRLGAQVTDQVVRRALPRALRDRYRAFGAETGHLGAGDLPANLADILAGDLLGAGECALLIGTGAGVTAGAIIVERE
ncbi:3-oxoacyl-[acyl-carrier-protein] synthase III C-terminal domain-containing protein [Lentzea jiangxiensis]|uniref:3-oxoacyl-[acyl-carrier-protein] synthase-3 n=1 Tax=Lentzea jiangxiensis TaxID=641025 RepID=A0A1H0WYR0_9PSEU|nr:3-oxoacyl-[acyl-carrier-protein] synthase III C-terminal domain-containing protein [Lentzea jiangxiensis]SDP95853.1 3-oxoacyl-[acyl-carrier-protein] synthase-3 [Lentzea jiangxiensis]